MTDRTPPQALDSERAVLGAMLTLPGAIPKAAEVLAPSQFYRTGHAHLFAALVDLHHAGTPIDLVSVAQSLTAREVIEQVGGPAALAELQEHACALANLGHHAGTIADRALARDLIRAALDTQEAAHDATLPASALVADAAARMSGIVERGRRAGLSAASRWTERLTPDRLIRPEPLLAGGILSAGDLGLIAGDGGLGKSRLAIELAVAMAHGGEWLGMHTSARPLRVGYVAAEFTTFRWVERLVRLFTGTCPRDPDELLSAFHALPLADLDGAFVGIPGQELDGPLNLLEPQAGEQLIALIRERGLDVCALDCLSRMMGGADETNEFFGQVLVTLDRVRFKTGCALLLVHHARKTASGMRKSDEDPMDLVRGGTKLRDGINTGLFLSQLDGGLLKLSCFKANYGRKPDPAYLRVPEDGGRMLLERGPEERRDHNAGRVIEWMRSHRGAFTSAEVATALGDMSERTARRYLIDFAKGGILAENTGPNRARVYSVPLDSVDTRTGADNWRLSTSQDDGANDGWPI